MNSLPLPPERARYEDDGMLLRVSMPPRRSPFTLVFLTAWLAVWFVAAATARHELMAPGPNTDRWFVIVWMTVWVAGGGFAAFTFVWMLFGREIIELGPDQLILQRRLLGIRRSRAYDLANVKELRVGVVVPPLFDGNMFQRLLGGGASRRPDISRTWEMWGLTGGPITFDCGPKTVRCGACLDEAEGKMVIERLRRRNSRLRPPESA